MKHGTDEPEEQAEPDDDVPPEVRERWRSRRLGAVKVLRALCALPALMVLYYAFFPKVNYTHRLTLAAPAAARTVAVGDVRLEQRDRALALVARDAAGKDRAGVPHVLVRNNVKSATLYHRLRDLPRPARYELTLGLPREAGLPSLRPQGEASRREPGDLVLPLDGWQLAVATSSDYATQLGHRVGGLILGLLLVGLAMLAIPRLIHVLWPDK